MKRLLNLYLFLSISVSVLSGNPEKTVSKYGKTYYLFKIERSRDSDILIYSLNVNSKGEVEPSEPIKVYWIKQKGLEFTQPLTLIQQKYAYGIKLLNYNDSEQIWSFQFVSYQNKTFNLKKTGNQSFKVTTTAGNQEIIVSSLFIHFENNSFWFPSISSVDLLGNDLFTGTQIKEKLTF